MQVVVDDLGTLIYDVLPDGARFEVLYGPHCPEDGELNYDGQTVTSPTWAINYNNILGWVAESGDGVYYLEPVN